MSFTKLSYFVFALLLSSTFVSVSNAQDGSEQNISASDIKNESIALDIFKDENIFRAIENLSSLNEEFEWLRLAVEARHFLYQGFNEKAEISFKEASRLSPSRSNDYVDYILGNVEIQISRRNRSQEEYEGLLTTFMPKHFGKEADLQKHQRHFDERKFEHEFPVKISDTSSSSDFSLVIEDTDYVPRILVPASINEKNINFLLDTGATGTTMFNPIREGIKLIRSQTTIPMHRFDLSKDETISLSTIETVLSKVPRITVDSTVIENAQILTVPGEHFDHLLKENIEGLFGYDLINKIGGLQFLTEDYKITEAIFFKPKNKRVNPLKGNLLTDYYQPHIKVSIAGKTYSCVFDTGASKTIITKAIYKEVKRDLNLKLIKGKKLARQKYNRPYLGRPWKNSEYIKVLPINTGGADIVLQQVLVDDTFKAGGDCLIGMDAVLEAGGAKLDFVNYEFALGPQNLVSK